MPGDAKSSARFEKVFVPSDGDVSCLSTQELKALVLAATQDQGRVPLEMSELRNAAELAVLQALDTRSMRAIVVRAGLQHRDCNTMDLLRARTRQAMERLRELEIPFRQPPTGKILRDNQFPVTWRRFDVNFLEPSLGFSIALDNGGNLVVVKVTGTLPLKEGVRPDDAIVAINGCSFAEVYDQATFERDVLQRLKCAPRPVRVTFLVGDGRWPPTSHLEQHTASAPVPATPSGPAPPRPPPPQAVKEPAAKSTAQQQQQTDYITVKFVERGTLGFSVRLNNTSRLEVCGVRQVANSPCFLAGVQAGDELVAMNGRKFGSVDRAQFSDVVTQLKTTRRPMVLTFKRTCPRQAPPNLRPSPQAESASKSIPREPASATAGKAQAKKAKPTPDAAPSRRETPPAKHLPPQKVTQSESSWKDFVAKSAAEALKATSPTSTATPHSPFSETGAGQYKAKTGDVYRYDAVFPKQLLGIALALSKTQDGALYVVVTEVRPTCTVTEVEVHDRLVAINGALCGSVTNESEFKCSILDKLKAAPRPLTLTFTSGVQGTICTSQSYAQDLFDEIDANGDGVLSQVELIKALRKHADLAKCLNLPQIIRQEDGSRDAFATLFHSLAVRDDKQISKREWAHGLAKMAVETII